jgi:enediyne polyketide synthase
VALGAKPVPAMFTDVALTRPITVPERDNRVLRVAALVREGGGLDVVARSEETGFAVDHFRARCAEPDAGESLADAVQLGQIVDGPPLYGPLFFHGPRFQRVRGYHGLSAYRCTAAISADPDARWFGAFHDQRLELGDPGARDAFLHALQGCVPDRRVLPVAVERVTVYRRPEGNLTLHARQRDQDADTFLFDLAISDAGRSVVEEWRGLRLRDVGPLPVDWRTLPIGLLGPFLARSLRRWQPQVDVDLAVAPARRTDRHRTAALAGWLSGARVEHAADGRLLVAGAGSASASHLDGRLLVAAGANGVAVDWARVGASPPLDEAAAALAGHLVRAHDEDPRRAACRAWTCREVLSKHGLPPDAPLIVAQTGPGDWIRLGSGGYRLYSVLVDTADGALAVCIGCG